MATLPVNIDYGEPYVGRWVNDEPTRRMMKGVCCEYNGRLWAPYHSREGVLCFDGDVVLRGGGTVGPTAGTGTMLHPTGSGLYATTMAYKATVSYSSKSGAFTMGERVTQATSGAIGYVYQDTGSALVIQVHTGVFNGTNIVTGTTSGKTATVTAVSTSATQVRFIERSADGFAAFAPVMDVRDAIDGSGFLPRQMVDCGVRSETILGTPNTRLLIYVEYVQTGTQPRILANQPDVAPRTWTVLMEAGIQDGVAAVRHGHGVKRSAVHDKLFFLFGDTDSQSCILVCDDIADLCNNPATWAERWAMDLFGEERIAYLTTGPGADYCAIAGSQRARTVDLVFDATETYGYYIPDNATTGVNTLHRIKLDDLSVAYGSERALGLGWVGRCLSDGTVLITAESDYGSHGEDEWSGNSDAYVRIYAAVPETLGLVEIYRARRRDGDNPAYQTVAYFGDLLEYQGRLWAWDYAEALIGGDACGRFLRGTVAFEATEKGVHAPLSASNFVENSRLAELDPYHLGLLRNTRLFSLLPDEVVPDTYGGTPVTLRTLGITDQAGPAYVAYVFDQRTMYALWGRWVTFRVRVLAPPTLAESQLPGISIITDNSEVSSKIILHTDKSTDFKTYFVSLWVAPRASTLQLIMSNRTETSINAGNVWFSDPCLVEGTIPPTGGLPPRNLSVRERRTQAGYYDKSVAAGNVTIAEIESLYSIINFTGAPGAPRIASFPTLVLPIGLEWTFRNKTAQPVNIRVGVLTGITLAAGKACRACFDGTDIVRTTPDCDPT